MIVNGHSFVSGEADYPDLSGDVKRLETQIQMLQIDNTELNEKYQIADKLSQQLQQSNEETTQQQKSLGSQLNTV